ncbi:hypothetical protein B0T20DRAFT_219394 [Sordaria brevicollis]|uniref:Uncharacterized protein n=1 Tax=Sordaria brevicollis TaxID=83679 RepID=A0AAE0PF78_SORBR|nr:hypothetical protein B0T20DRAFT_219394 [Sordaria brevicollis]
MNNNTDFSQLWHRHLANLRDEFTTGAVDSNSVRALPSEPTRSVDGRDSEATPRGIDHHGGQVSSLLVGHGWDGDMEMVIDALQELEVQSPITATEALSPESPWFRESHHRRDTDETETVLSSPQNSSWSRTIAPSKLKRNRWSLPQPQPKSPINLYTSAATKGRETDATARAQKRHSQDWYRDHATLLSHSQQLYETYSAVPASPSLNTARPEPETEPRELKPRFSSIFYPTPRGRYAEATEEVSVLILNWATSTATSAKTSPQGPNRHCSSRPGIISTSTESIRNCFKRLGYRVQCRPIPEDYPTAAVETILAKFLEDSSDGDQTKKKLLIVYYTGRVSMVEGRMMFINAPGTSHFFWEDIREPIMSSENDVLLIFDCHIHRPVVNLNGSTEGDDDDQMLVEPGLASSPSIKQLLGSCVPVPLHISGTDTAANNKKSMGAPKSIEVNQMTDALCSILDSIYARGDGKISVQRLCSFMKEELRQAGTGIEQRVFVTQLGGKHLLDIELPMLSVGSNPGIASGNSIGGSMLPGMDILRG